MYVFVPTQRFFHTFPVIAEIILVAISGTRLLRQKTLVSTDLLRHESDPRSLAHN